MFGLYRKFSMNPYFFHLFSCKLLFEIEISFIFLYCKIKGSCINLYIVVYVKIFLCKILPYKDCTTKWSSDYFFFFHYYFYKWAQQLTIIWNLKFNKTDIMESVSNKILFLRKKLHGPDERNTMQLYMLRWKPV